MRPRALSGLDQGRTWGLTVMTGEVMIPARWEKLLDLCQILRIFCVLCHVSLDWFKGKIFSLNFRLKTHLNDVVFFSQGSVFLILIGTQPWFPVDFPFNQ